MISPRYNPYKVFLLLIITLLPFVIDGQVRVDWAKNYGNDRNNLSYNFSKINDNSFLIAGTSWKNSSHHFDGALFNVDDTGHILWSQTFGNEYDEIVYDAVATTGGALLTGFSGENNGSLFVGKISANGEIIWTNIYPHFYNSAAKIFALSDGNMLIAATSSTHNTAVSGGYGHGDLTLIKLNANGELLFRKNYGGARFDKLLGGMLTNDNHLLLVGATWSGDGIFQENHGLSDGFIVKISTSGNLRWSKIIGSEFEDELVDITMTNTGDYVAIGTTGSVKASDYKADADNLLVKIDATGNVVWQRVIGDTEHEKGKAIAAIGNSLVFAGTKMDDNYNTTVYQTDANGVVVFDTLFIGDETDVPTDILVDNNILYISGYSRSSIVDFYDNYGQTDMWAIRMNGLSGVEAQIPQCISLSTPADGTTDVDIHEPLVWEAAQYADGYKLSIGTSPGESDILEDLDLGDVLTYSPGTWLCGTTYYVTLTPYNTSGEPVGCAEQTFTTEHITATVSGDITMCRGESAELSAAGGDVYTWTPALGLDNPGSAHPIASPQETTTYTVTVTSNNGCTDTGEITVTINPTPIPNLTATDETASNANDGTITANPVSGVPPYEFLWNTGETTAILTNLAPGDYTVTVTDSNGCTGEQTITIHSFECNGLIVDHTEANVSCHGEADGFIHLMPNSNNPPYSYLWDDGTDTGNIDNLPAGDYSVTVTDAAGCHETIQFTISQPDELVATTEIQPPTASGNDGNIQVTPLGGAGPYEILWSTGFTGYLLQNVGEGVYSFLLTDAHGCQYTDTINLSTNAVEELAILDNLTIFPNPNNGNFQMTWESPKHQTGIFSIHTSLGQTVWKKQILMTSLHATVHLHGMPGGVYFLQITTKEGKIVRKLIVR